MAVDKGIQQNQPFHWSLTKLKWGELIRPKAIFMREEKVAVENPWAANRHYSSSLPSGKIPMSDDSIWTSVNAFTQMISQSNCCHGNSSLATKFCTSPPPRDTCIGSIQQERETRMFKFQNWMHFNRRIARTQSTTNKNYAFELPTFGVIVGVSQTDVQWKGLTLEEPPSWSWLTSTPGKYEEWRSQLYISKDQWVVYFWADSMAI